MSIKFPLDAEGIEILSVNNFIYGKVSEKKLFTQLFTN